MSLCLPICPQGDTKVLYATFATVPGLLKEPVLALGALKVVPLMLYLFCTYSTKIFRFRVAKKIWTQDTYLDL